MLNFISNAHAQTAAAPVLTAGGETTSGGVLMQFLPLILIFAIFYFIIIRPQQRRMTEHAKMLGALRRGDKIVTGGGIVGTITKIDDEDDLHVEIAANTVVTIRRNTVTECLTKPVPATNDNKAA